MRIDFLAIPYGKLPSRITTYLTSDDLDFLRSFNSNQVRLINTLNLEKIERLVRSAPGIFPSNPTELAEWQVHQLPSLSYLSICIQGNRPRANRITSSRFSNPAFQDLAAHLPSFFRCTRVFLVEIPDDEILLVDRLPYDLEDPTMQEVGQLLNISEEDIQSFNDSIFLQGAEMYSQSDFQVNTGSKR